MTDAGDLKIILTRVFDGPRALIYKAWTEKKYLDQWCAPNGFTIRSSEADFRVGGAWQVLMIAPNGEPFPVRGIYREIVPNELILQTHGWVEDDGSRPHETVLTVRFADEGSGTKVTLEQGNFKSVESREGHRGGWSECLDHLAELLTKEK